MREVQALFQAMLRRWVAADARVDTVELLSDVAQDHSGAIVHFYHVTYTTQAGCTAIDLVTKDSLIYERHVLALLNSQGHPHIPLSYSLDMHTPTPCLLCQQHAGTRRPLSYRHIATVAQTLATLHAVNRGAPYLPWMRRLTSRAFFRWWQPVWEQACANTEFARVFHAYLLPVERAAQRFTYVLDELWQDGSYSTVLHTDLSAWHVLLRDDQPYLIDWEQARYGPLFLDLVNFFTPQTVHLYYDALLHAGVAVAYETFLAHYHAVWAFVGLKYMVPALLTWLDGERETSEAQLHQLLPRAIATRAPVE